MITKIHTAVYKNISFNIYFDDYYPEPLCGRFKLEISELNYEKYHKLYDFLLEDAFEKINKHSNNIWKLNYDSRTISI